MRCITEFIPDDDGYVAAIDADDVRERQAAAIDYEALPHIWYHVTGFDVITDGEVIQQSGEWLQVYSMGAWDNPDSYLRVHVTDVVEARARKSEPIAVDVCTIGEDGYLEIKEIAA